jgi:radical SAM superfamily enzyme YgiQ (UPF0313 family)
MNETPRKTLFLIMPPLSGLLNGFSSGLISLANYASKRMPGLDIHVLDLSSSETDEVRQELSKRFSNFKDSQIFTGITTTTASYQSAISVAKIVKDLNPRAITILGGHHAGADAETVLKHHAETVDLVIAGEGERSLLELLKDHSDYSRVPGAFHYKNGVVVKNAPPIPLNQEELDSIQITFKSNEIIGTPGKFNHVTYVSARGCPLPCAFCAVGNDKIRAKNINVVLNDISQLLEMGWTQIAIEDNFFAHAPKRTREICLGLAELKEKKRIDFSWDCQTRVESLARPDTIELLTKAGCEAVYIGVESLIPEHLAYLNKAPQPEKYLQKLIDVVIPLLMKSPINCYLNLQVGIPGETSIHHEKTISVLRDVGEIAARHGKKITIFPQLHVVYPGTTHYRVGVAEGRFPKDVFESFTLWEAQEEPILQWLGEHFAHGTGGVPEGIMKPELLRENKFEVDSKAVFRILEIMGKIEKLKGIDVFHYGKYIVPKTKFLK